MSNGMKYAKFYGHSVRALSGLSTKQLQMYIYLASEVKMVRNELSLTRSDKDKAARTVGIKPNSVNNILSKYCRLDLMVNRGGGVFILNPNVTNRGRYEDQHRLMMSYLKAQDETPVKKK
ncbi:replication/maintenance protein RepL [Paraglaciecola sp.]|jgi:hypothetical protein|uniref:replication/maintenance protein RepL n=1 Tax=Paraglaciecola sp. TaxID=1920173 RepID=UPI00326427FF